MHGEVYFIGESHTYNDEYKVVYGEKGTAEGTMPNRDDMVMVSFPGNMGRLERTDAKLKWLGIFFNWPDHFSNGPVHIRIGLAHIKNGRRHLNKCRGHLN